MIGGLALLVAAAGTACTLAGLLAARLGADPRVAWLGLAAGGGSLLPLLSQMAAEHGAAERSALEAGVLVVPVAAVVVLVIALIAPGPVRAWPVAAAVLGGAALATGAGLLWAIFPGPVHTLSDLLSLRLALVSAWTGLALAISLLPVCRRDRTLCLVAAGTALIGAVGVAEVVLIPEPLDEGSVVAPAVRLAAVVLALSGTVALVHRALTRIEALRDAQEEELRMAAIRIEHAAERDHELRNGLAGIAGAARLLGNERSDSVRLDALVASELSRLDSLLRQAPAVDAAPEPPTASYEVEPVLRGLVALRSASGMDLRLEVDTGLRALGSPAVLAQVITNLLGNVERHAPGSPARITAMRWNGRAVVRIRDFGPGVPPGREALVLEPGVRDERRGGRGLGLHVCRRMLGAEHGTISIRPREPTRPGCVVVVELIEPATDRAVAPPVRREEACAAR